MYNGCNSRCKSTKVEINTLDTDLYDLNNGKADQCGHLSTIQLKVKKLTQHLAKCTLLCIGTRPNVCDLEIDRIRNIVYINHSNSLIKYLCILYSPLEE